MQMKPLDAAFRLQVFSSSVWACFIPLVPLECQHLLQAFKAP